MAESEAAPVRAPRARARMRARALVPRAAACALRALRPAAPGVRTCPAAGNGSPVPAGRDNAGRS